MRASLIGASLLLCLAAVLPSWSQAPCGQLRSGTPLPVDPLLIPAGHPKPEPPSDYRHRLQTTPLGWPLQSTWCVWVQPADTEAPPSTATQRWLQAVAGALKEWQQVLPIVLVNQPELAQVTIWRQRPPLRRDAKGRRRASHGRAILSLQKQRGDAHAQVEPRVEVLIGPGQRLEALQATALHELGHAFGLWGHSDEPGDAMAVSPGATPVLQLSLRDRRTLEWLYQQPSPMRLAP